MNKKVFVLAIALMAVAMLATPLVACVNAIPKELSPAWHTYPATDDYYGVTYEELTQMCLDAGLSENPYPTPLEPIEEFDSSTGILTVTGGSQYFIFTITIGDEEYTGVACNTFDMTFCIYTGEGHTDYQSIHYFGDLGKMNHGFTGDVTVDIYSTYFIGSWDFEGFGLFTGQSLTLYQDTRTDPIATGECLVLGNKWY